MSYLHNNKGVPFLHGNFKPSDVLVPAKTLQPKITNFALWDFKNFFIDNAQPELDHIQLLNPCQAPEVLGIYISILAWFKTILISPFVVGGERPTLFSDIWSLASVILQWLLEAPTWDFQELCSRYKYRENKHVSAGRLLTGLCISVFLLIPFFSRYWPSEKQWTTRKNLQFYNVSMTKKILNSCFFLTRFITIRLIEWTLVLLKRNWQWLVEHPHGPIWHLTSIMEVINNQKQNIMHAV